MAAPAGEGKTQEKPHALGPVEIVPDFFESLLVVAPHPDDEVIAAGGLIHRMRALGRRVRVVVVSDGRASHPSSQLFRPQALAALRRTESLAALGSLGVGRESIHFCDFPDGQSAHWESMPHPLARLASAVFGPFDLVCLPSSHDNHADHRMARELTRRFLTDSGLTLSYTVWPSDDFPPSDRTPAVHRMDAATQAAKAAALRLYRSQVAGIADAPDGFTIDAPTFARFTAPVESFTL